MYPDQSLYPANSVPAVVKRINNALMRRDQIEYMEGEPQRDWMVPIVADAEAGFGGNLNAFELMKGMIEAGAAGVHWEDQLASAKKCGHLGGKGISSYTRSNQQIGCCSFGCRCLQWYLHWLLLVQMLKQQTYYFRYRST
jgi:isocitrate lyase